MRHRRDVTLQPELSKSVNIEIEKQQYIKGLVQLMQWVQLICLTKDLKTLAFEIELQIVTAQSNGD